jgi:hypothetical protein
LLAYALALVLQIIFDRSIPIILLAPAALWIGAALHLLPEDTRLRPILIRVWVFATIPLAILTQLNPWFSVPVILALVFCVGMIAKLAARSYFKNTLALLAVIALLVTLSTGLLLLPLDLIPLAWGMALLGVDLFLLGVAIIVWDAFEEGETIRAHLVRSFVSALYYSGALALIAGAFNANTTLLICLVTFAILTQTFSNSIQFVLDILTLPEQLNDERQILRQTAESLPLLSALEDPSLNDEQFARLTRRALSHLGDLPKLAASPLINLPIVQGANSLDRAHALKSVLVQSIQKLKPKSDAKFGATDEWRFYNAVYFPYVLGLKPYSRSVDLAALDEASRAALDWFQVSVPERTLHNWQNTAAKLIADDIAGLVSRAGSPV